MEQAEDGQGAGEFGHGVWLSPDRLVIEAAGAALEGTGAETFKVYDWDIPAQSWVFRGAFCTPYSADGRFDEKSGVAPTLFNP